MSISFRITRELYDAVIRDLNRPHAFAAERVGFVLIRPGNSTSENRLVLASDYQGVADKDYVRDRRVGARISGQAIRAVMEKLLNEPVGAFHVHIHPHFGQPGFSRVDLANLPPLIQSFVNVSPTLPHGAVIFSEDSATGICWLPGESQARVIEQISVVGHPMSIWSN